jgi:hypothetical protein
MPVIVTDGEAEYLRRLRQLRRYLRNPEGRRDVPSCERLFCLDCQAPNSIEAVQVRDTGPVDKQYEYLCRLCREDWEAHTRNTAR